MQHARRELLRSPSGASVTEIAVRFGFTHFGRFSSAYRARYGESPSTTLRRCRSAPAVSKRASSGHPPLERPAVSVAAFTTSRTQACGIASEIAAALRRRRVVDVGVSTRVRYRLCGKVEADRSGRLRVIVMLIDRMTNRCLRADRWVGESLEVPEFAESVATAATASIERALRAAEVERVSRKDRDELNAWELTMRAFPHAVSISAARQAEALELLEQAIELAPTDPLPIAMAAWCHGQRGGHHFTGAPAVEKQAAHDLAGRAEALDPTDPMALALLASAYTLAHDLPHAATNFQRALVLDGACAWAWNRSGWVNVYRGETEEAIDRFQIARHIAPDDPLKFFCSIGIAAAHFEAGRYDDAACWFSRGLSEHPSAVWANRFRAPAYALAGKEDNAKQSFLELTRAYPRLTISDIRTALPHTLSYLDRASEGLEALGMRLQ